MLHATTHNFTLYTVLLCCIVFLHYLTDSIILLSPAAHLTYTLTNRTPKYLQVMDEAIARRRSSKSNSKPTSSRSSSAFSKVGYFGGKLSVREKHRPSTSKHRAQSTPDHKRHSGQKNEQALEVSYIHGFQNKMHLMWLATNGLRKEHDLSDVVLQCDDGQRFYCNSFVLAQWSKMLLEKAEKRGETGEWVAKIEGFSSQSVFEALRLLFGGSVDDIDCKRVEEVHTFAEAYQIPDLKVACAEAVNTQSFSVKNLCALWLYGERFNHPKVVRRAQHFLYSNLKAVIENGDDDWKRLSRKPNFMLNFFEASLKFTHPDDEIEPPEVTASMVQRAEDEKVGTVGYQLRQLWNESGGRARPHGYSDVIVVTRNNRRFFAHSALVHLTSPSFALFLQKEREKNKSNEVRIQDTDVAVEEFLRFVYRQKPGAGLAHVAEQVYDLAIQYGVPGLAEICERLLALQHLSSVESAVQFLSKAVKQRMHNAKKMCFRYLYNKHGPRLSEVMEWKRLVEDKPQLLVEMLIDSKRFRGVKEEYLL